MIQSPCNKICTLNAEDVCVGCGRSRAEIGGWTQFDDAAKKRVIAAAKERLAAMAARQARDRQTAAR